VSIPDTADLDPVFLAIQPDWSKGVRHSYFFSTAVNEARSGREQRVCRRRHPTRLMDYWVTGLTEYDSLNLHEVRKNRARTPLKVPWWAEGQRLSLAQPDADTVILETIPLPEEFPVGGEIYLGGIVRTIESVMERTLTLVTATATAQAANTWVYPVRLCVAESGDTAITRRKPAGADENLSFRTL